MRSAKNSAFREAQTGSIGTVGSSMHALVTIATLKSMSISALKSLPLDLDWFCNFRVCVFFLFQSTSSVSIAVHLQPGVLHLGSSSTGSPHLTIASLSAVAAFVASFCLGLSPGLTDLISGTIGFVRILVTCTLHSPEHF